MLTTVDMPQIGDDELEGTVSEWLVEIGEAVQRGQAVCRVATDDACGEVPSPCSGVVAHLLVPEGESAKVGAALLEIELPSEEVEDTQGWEGAGRANTATSGIEAPLRETSLLKDGDSDERRAPRRSSTKRRGLHSHTSSSTSPVVRKLSDDRAEGTAKARSRNGLPSFADRLPAEPPREAKKEAIDSPFGPEDAPDLPAVVPLLRHDSSYSPFGGLYKVPIYRPKTGDRVVPFSRRRRIIAEHMAFSKQVAPHVTAVAEVDMTRVMRLTRTHGAAFKKREGFKLTLLPFVVDASVRAIKQFPQVNATVQIEALVLRRDINMGIAVETDEGLVVPVIHGAQNMNLAGLARVISMLSARAREGCLEPSDLEDGSFTISNPGQRGNLFDTPVIHQPQIAVIRMGTVVKRPMVLEVDGEDVIAIRHMMYLALSYDHRVVDGLLGNRFLHRVKALLEEAGFSGF